jgi:hypothetical protein
MSHSMDLPCKHLDLARIRKSGGWKINDILAVLDTSFVMLDLVSVALLIVGPLLLQFVVRRTGSTATSLYVEDTQGFH